MGATRDKKPGFDSEFTGHSLKIKLRGEIDHHSAVAIRTSIDDMIKRRLPNQLVVDMSAVDFMDSSGLGLIMGRYALMKELGGNSIVLDPSPRIQKIMSLAGMERILTIAFSDKEKIKIQGKNPTAAASMSQSNGSRHTTSKNRQNGSQCKSRTKEIISKDEKN